MLQIRNLTVKIGEKEILHDIDFSFEKGKIYAILGPNGSGKSTLAFSILGYPRLTLSEGSKIIFEGRDITHLPPEKRAKLGIFMTFQNPVSLTGVNLYQLLSFRFKRMNFLKIQKRIQNISRQIFLTEGVLKRSFDVGLSGGEKKKIEFLQSVLFRPKMVIFDEIDTGLDVDSLKRISHVFKEELRGKTTIFITHYSRILNFIKPDTVLVLKNGRISAVGDFHLVEKIEKEGYQQF